VTITQGSSGVSRTPEEKLLLCQERESKGWRAGIDTQQWGRSHHPTPAREAAGVNGELRAPRQGGEDEAGLRQGGKKFVVNGHGWRAASLQHSSSRNRKPQAKLKQAPGAIGRVQVGVPGEAAQAI